MASPVALPGTPGTPSTPDTPITPRPTTPRAAPPPGVTLVPADTDTSAAGRGLGQITIDSADVADQLNYLTRMIEELKDMVREQKLGIGHLHKSRSFTNVK